MTNKISKVIHNGTEFEFESVNGGVTSVNGQTGDVTIQEGIEYNSGPGIKIGSYSDMQGPAPDGFHVPSKNEWVALCGILNTAFSMEYNYTTMETYLKMPRAGYRDFSSSSVRGVGDYGYYWYSTPSGANAYYLFFSSSVFNIQNNTYRSKCHSIRCFKNSPTVPTSSWTTLYDGSSVASGAGVFWNSTEGLISVSGDGHTWYTIMDKNLGATTAYNQGDTLTDANCGNFYQWGNNYGFPHSGTVTVSTTLVDASNYGPGNYYSNSTFIIADIPYDRSSVRNDNLWGGVTGVTTLDNAITNTGVLSVNGQTGDVTINSGITKIFTLSSTSDLTTAQAAYDWIVSGGNPILLYSSYFYTLNYKGAGWVDFSLTEAIGNSSAGQNLFYLASLRVNLSSGTVTSIAYRNNFVGLSNTAPTSGDNSKITLVI